MQLNSDRHLMVEKYGNSERIPMNEVQKRELSVYNEVAKICDKHGLKYFAIGGTCIGAIRHKGFIPWDDDIDIALPRQDYEKLRTDYYKDLPGYLQVLDCDNSRQHLYLFFKIHDSRTTFVERYAQNSPERYTGAFVDIMPIDGLPNDAVVRNKIIKKLMRLDKANDRHRPVPLSAYNGSFSGPAKWLLRKMFSLFHEYNYYSSRVKEIGESYNFSTSEKCIFTWRAGSSDLSIERIVFDRSLFDDLIDVPFEDSLMRIPKEYDKYLKQDFGDYMKLPPKEQQQTHHNVYISDMGTPCREYAERDIERYKKQFRRQK